MDVTTVTIFPLLYGWLSCCCHGGVGLLLHFGGGGWRWWWLGGVARSTLLERFIAPSLPPHSSCHYIIAVVLTYLLVVRKQFLDAE